MLGLGNTLSGGIVPAAAVDSFDNTYSLAFDGVDDYVDLGDSNVFSFGDSSDDSPFSVSAWVNMRDATKFRIVGKSGTGTGNIEWLFSANGSDLLSLYLYDNAGGQQIGRHSAALTSSEDSWIHVAATYSGGGSSTDINIYVNGANANDSVSSAGSYTAMHNGTGGLDIGRFKRGGFPGTVDYAQGNIDEVAIFNAELDAEAVSAMYNNGAPTDLSSESNLVGYWRMGDGATYPTIPDDSSNSNDGTMTNMTSGDLVEEVPG